MAMSEIAVTPNERDEIEMLLPWYVTGRLDEVDRARIEDWLKRDPALAFQLQLIEEERQQAIAAAEGIRLPAHMSPHHVLARIPDRLARGLGFLQGVTRWFDDLLTSLTLPALRWAAAAAVMIILVQSVGIGTLLRDNGGHVGYQTASGNKTSSDGVFVLVRPVETATIATLSKTLRALDASIAGGPSPDGYYRVRIGASSLSREEVEAKLNRLRQRTDAFQVVLPEPRGK
jgi:anti-sigma-K factor RskA